MDLDSFAAREFRAGEMAVVFYRKHPGQDEQLQVRLDRRVERRGRGAARAAGFVRRLTAFDTETTRCSARSPARWRSCWQSTPRLGGETPPASAASSLRPALENLFRVIFGVQRTRGKVREWFSNVDDAEKIRVAQSLASVRRKMQSLNPDGAQPGLLAPFDAQAARVRGWDGAVNGGSAGGLRGRSRRLLGGMLRTIGTHPAVLPRLRAADRFLHESLQSHPASLSYYRRARRRVRSMFG